MEQGRVREPEQVAHAISDHKIGVIEITTDQEVNRDIPAYQPAAAYAKPQEEVKEAWRARIRNHYKHAIGHPYGTQRTSEEPTQNIHRYRAGMAALQHWP